MKITLQGMKVKQQKLLAPEVVIVPIFWKGEAGQRARVLSACADADFTDDWES